MKLKNLGCGGVEGAEYYAGSFFLFNLSKNNIENNRNSNANCWLPIISESHKVSNGSLLKCDPFNFHCHRL